LKPNFSPILTPFEPHFNRGGEKEGLIEFREFCALLTMAHGKGALYDQIERMKQQLWYLHAMFLAFDVDSDQDVVFSITAIGTFL